MRSRNLRVVGLGLAGLVAAVVLPAAPAHAAWGTIINVNIQVTHSSSGHQLGKVTGTIQFETNTTQFRYDLTFCRQSSYALPTLEIRRNYISFLGSSTYVTTVNADWNVPADPGCYSWTGKAADTVTTGTVRDLYLILHGSTFEGSSYVIVSEDQFLNSPYA